MTPSRRRLAGALLVVIIAVVVALLQTGGDDGGDGGPAPVAAGATTAVPAATTIASPSTAAPSAPADSGTTRTTTLAPTRTTRAAGLQLVALSSLPDEAADTWALIEADGPFPYDRDGVVFENREQLLPRRAKGFYREFTVPTPGEDDRGARRLVLGDDDAVFYTGDHYDSFVQVDVAR